MASVSEMVEKWPKPVAYCLGRDREGDVQTGQVDPSLAGRSWIRYDQS